MTSEPPVTAPVSIAPPAKAKQQKGPLAWLARVLPALAAIALLIMTFRSADLGRAWGLILGLGFALPLLLIPQGVAVALDAAGWGSVFRGLGRPVPFLSLFEARVGAETVFMSMPSGALIAEALQPYLLRRRGVRFEEAVVGTMARKVYIILSQGLFLAISVAAGYEALQRASKTAIGRAGLPVLLLTASLVLVSVATVLGTIFFYGKVAQRSRAALERLGLSWLRPWLERNAHRFGATDDHLARYFSGGWTHLARPLPIFLAMWLVKAFETWLFVRLLGSPIGFGSAMALETSIILVRVLIVAVPGGLGVQDLGYVLFMRAFGVPDASTVGAALALLKRGKEIIWTIAGLPIFFSARRRGPLTPGNFTSPAA
jgi:glycosyltransferase 2 family protein